MKKKLSIEISKTESGLIQYLQNYKHLFLFAIITIFALLIRKDQIYFTAGDYVLSFRPWSEYLVQNGGFAGIPTLQSD